MLQAPLLDTRKAAALLGISFDTLRAFRRTGIGPQYIKVGHQFRYSISDLEEYLESHTVVPSS